MGLWLRDGGSGLSLVQILVGKTEKVKVSSQLVATQRARAASTLTQGCGHSVALTLG